MTKGPIGRHRTNRVGWLRAAVLGANDGVLSTASLVLGVAAAHGSHNSVLVAGAAGLVAGSMSMAAGEYVSVHSQADTESADLRLERHEIKVDPKGEHRELAAIYVDRGLDPGISKTSSATAYGPQCVGSACAGRTRHYRGSESTPDPGSADVSRQLRRGSRAASSDLKSCPAASLDSIRSWSILDLSCSSWRSCCTSGRGSSDKGSTSGYVLGCTGNGHYGGRWNAIQAIGK
jgi:hypothetical protein